MNKKIAFPELVELIADTTNSSKRLSELFLKELFGTISQALIDGESVKVKSLGTFKLTKVSVRKSVDVNTGEEIEIPSHNKLTFIPDKNLAEAINTPFSQFETIVLSDEVTNEELAAVEQEDSEPVAEAEPTAAIASETGVESPIADETAGDSSAEPEEVEASAEAVEETETAETLDEDEPAVVETPPPFVLREDASDDVPPAPEAVAEEVKDNALADEDLSAAAPEAADDSETATAASENEEDAAAPIGKTGTEPEAEAETVADEETPDEADAEAEQMEVAADEIQTDITAADSGNADQEENDEATEPEPEVTQPEVPQQQIVLPSDYQRIEFEKKLKEETRKSLMRGFLWGVLVAVFACCVIGYLLYTSHTQNQQPPMAEIVPDTLVEADSVAEKPKVEQKDTATVAQKTPAQTRDGENKPETGNKVVRDTINGRTLMSMSTKHYGKWCFWVYIYEENKGKIANPNNMRPGTVLVIPPAEKYGIDPKDKASVEKAKKKSFEILKHYEK